MVRRRPRANKILAVPPCSGDSGENEVTIVSIDLLQTNNFDGVVAAAVPNLEDQFFASPKRKDCKIDSIHVHNKDTTDDVVVVAAVVGSGNADGDGKMFDMQKSKVSLSSPGKTRAERKSGRTIGVPLATRSQTRTIENFFKASTAAKTAKIKAEIFEKQLGSEDIKAATQKVDNKISNNGSNDSTSIVRPITNGHCKFPIESANPFQRQHSVDATNNQPEFFFDLSEDTNDTDNTELSDEYSAASGASSNAIGFRITNTNFETHRSPLRDSHSSLSSTTDNIFLQEPVLTLNVDKSPNQASSIKINKTLEIEPIFSSPPAITAAVLNGRFNKVVSLNGSPSLRDSFGYDTQPIIANTVNCCVLNLAENDNSSCDSGVAFGTNSAGSNTFEINLPNSIVAATAPATRRRKPATPHRIVCPSPIKAAPRMASPAGAGSVVVQYSPSARKIAASKEQLSPRKSQRHLAATAGLKTRRRLNQMKEYKAPYQTINQTMQNGYRQNGHLDNEGDDDDDDLEFENLEDAATVSVAFYETPPKMILNQTQVKNLTAQQQQHNRMKIHKTKTTTTAIANVVAAATTATQQPKMKLHHQAPQPLATTNGNRELTEFFPVRRSVRKTKSAVKEEMMRNLEQAILEERSEGLRIEHFDGKGRGVIADRRFERGDFVIEYVGDLISMAEAAEREKCYALDENAGCYMYYFKHKNQQYCIDATMDTGKLGRLVNHSRNGNLITKVVVVKQRPHLILIAKDDIESGEELTYDYGDRSKESLIHHPWLAF